MLCSATASDYPLAPFANPDFYLASGKKFFRPHSILRGLVQATKTIPSLRWEHPADVSTPVGTIMATLLPQWLTAVDVPEPHPPNWRTDQVLRPRWLNQEKTEGHLEFIPPSERSSGHRSCPRLEDNTRNGFFRAHPALQRAMDITGDTVSSESS
ncbi:hypothetical protein BGZ50_008691 [Haplosporangium sp. Z 11]|nr:hypothetical protein BGZ50_008691 [Haplosporangium sp. Z 11]